MKDLDAAWQLITGKFDSAQAKAAGEARAKAAGELNQIARRLKQYANLPGWYSAVLDGAARFATEIALFAVEGDALMLKGCRDLELREGSSLGLGQAAAFRNALDTKEPTVALRTRNEVSELLASPATAARAYVIPILNGTRVVAMLFAGVDESSSANALELIATVASAVLERNSQTPAHVQISGVGTGHPAQDHESPDLETRETSTGLENSEQPAGKKNAAAPALAGLSVADQLMHVKAQRLARVKVAEMQLYRPEACASGREQKNLYVSLGQEIGNARDLFSKQFMSTRSMVDYLHLELVEKLAHNNEELLGADYPGQMD